MTTSGEAAKVQVVDGDYDVVSATKEVVEVRVAQQEEVVAVLVVCQQTVWFM
jgi:hypothetical protein